LEKNAKIASASRAPPPNPRWPPAAGASPPDLRVVTPAYYYNFVKFISSAKFGLLPLKKNKFCIFQIFAAIFHFKLCSFCWQGAQKYFLPQGAGYPSYATG